MFYCFYKKMKCNKDYSLCEFSKIFKDISQEKRLQILCILSKTKSLCVCEIIEKLWIKQNLTSHHLKVLKDLWFISAEKKWKNIHYSINHKTFDKFKIILKNLFNI